MSEAIEAVDSVEIQDGVDDDFTSADVELVELDVAVDEVDDVPDVLPTVEKSGRDTGAALGASGAKIAPKPAGLKPRVVSGPNELVSVLELDELELAWGLLDIGNELFFGCLPGTRNGANFRGTLHDDPFAASVSEHFNFSDQCAGIGCSGCRLKKV